MSMRSTNGFVLVEDRNEVLAGFNRWMEALVWGMRRETSRRYWSDAGDFGAILEKPGHTLITTDSTFDTRVVDVNVPNNPRTPNGLSGLARDADGRLWLCRQGRLQRSTSSDRIDPQEFSELAGQSPDFETDWEGRKADRIWYRVACLDEEPPIIFDRTAEFAWFFDSVRRAKRGDPPLAGFKARGATTIATVLRALELEGSYRTSLRDAAIVRRVHAKVVNALCAELSNAEVRHTKLRGPNGYTADLVVYADTGKLLIEVKANATASDFQTAVGQLSLYGQLIEGLEEARRVILVPKLPFWPLADAVAALGVDWTSYAWDGAAGEGVPKFDENLLALCGISRRVS